LKPPRLLSPLSVKEMPHLEIAGPGFTAAIMQWMIESAYNGAEWGLRVGRGRISFMARDLREMFRDVFELSESDRATLAGLLIESLEPPPDPDAEELWAVEEERRWLEIESGAVQTIPWEEVRARLFRRR
jgi:putative addiction module component (TIGR02574 family)